MKLSGWAAIAEYVDRSEKVVRKWGRERNFPVVKLDGCVESDTDLIDKWRKLQIEDASRPKQSVAGGNVQHQSVHA